MPPDDPDDELPRDTVAVEPAAVPTIQMDSGRPGAQPGQLWSGEHGQSAFGRFEIIDIIGAGGMGVVLSAHDPQLDRKVAIKVLRTRGMMGERRVREAARLLREARALAQLSHPNVVTVYEAGTIDDRVYIAMELVDGQSLRAWQARRGTDEILDAYIKAGRGLAAGHAAGVIHRDFKPDNVLIGTDGRVRVIDFGLAQPGRAASETEPSDAPASSARVTFETTTSFGTPVYMAPEQHSRDRADARADQFAFCVALYEALFGRLPFAGATYGELVVNVTSGAVDMPAAAHVPAPVIAALRRGLKPDPAERFPSMDAVLAALHPPAAPARTSRRRTIGLVALAGAAAMAGTLAAVTLSSSPRDPCAGGSERLAGAWDDAVRGKVKAAFAATQRSYADATFDRAGAGLDAYAADWVGRRRDVCEATQVRHERTEAAQDAGMACLAGQLDQLRALTTLFASADTDVVDNAVIAIEHLPPPVTCATLTAAQPAASPEIDTIAALVDLGKWTRAVELARPRLAASTDPRLHFLYALALKRAGQGPEAETAMHEAARLAALAKDDVTAARAWTELVAIVGFLEGRYDEALELDKVAEVSIQRADADRDVSATLAYNLGSVHYQKGELAKARAAFEQALALRRDDADGGRALNSLGGVQVAIGDIAEGRKTLERALAIDDKVLGPRHPETALVLANLGAVAQKQGDFDAAARYAERALAILEEVNGSDSLNVGLALNNLGSFALLRLDFTKANDYLTRAIAIFDKVDRDNARIALPLIGRAQARDGLKQFRGAVEDAERALAILDRKGTDRAQLADARLDLADVLWDAGGDRKRAIGLARDAKAIYDAGGDKSKQVIVNLWLAGHAP